MLITGGVLVLLAATGFRVAGAWPPFRDLRDHWVSGVVNMAMDRGWIKGEEGGQFRPDAPMTRAEFYKLLVTAMRLQVQPGKDAPFLDKEHWLIDEGWAQAAIDAGLLLPADYGQDLHPDWPITRQEALLAVVRATGREGQALALYGAPLTIADIQTIPPWLQGWAAVGLQAGLLHGDGAGELHLSDPATRAEALVLVQRAVEQVTPGIQAFEGEASAQGLRFPRPGEPVWQVGPWDGLAPTVLGGTFKYALPAFAKGILITPAPGGAAWISYTAESATSNNYEQVFALAREGKVAEVRRQPLTAQFERPLAVDEGARLTFTTGGAVKRLDRAGVVETLADNLVLEQGVYTKDGTLWAVGGEKLYRLEPKKGWSMVYLPVTEAEKIQSLHTSPSGGIWLLIWDARLHQTRAVEVVGATVKRSLVLIPAHLHGPDPMPARPVITGEGEIWLARERRVGETEVEQTGLFRFDLKAGSLEPFVAPPQLEGPFVLRPSVSGGALVGDGKGRFWQLVPKGE
ncbi:MAG TPA: S-layer homology domain-containing protein [Symbiobacteriaceae bacterium]|nr:S-layer homology domain-containing protein [Symbiobacteriaceae bacterium]